MDATLAIVIAIVAVALIFDYTNGFHDAANAIATSVATKAMSARVALLIAALGNLAGAFISEDVAKAIWKGLIDAPEGVSGLTIVIATLIGAITWNLITWWFGIPSSSSHALIGGLVGAALAASNTVHWWSFDPEKPFVQRAGGVIGKVLIPMIASPLLGFTAAFGLTLLVQWLFRKATRPTVGPGFRATQVAASSAMAVGHGLQDAQKTMGIITLALVIGGYQSHEDEHIHPWVKIAAALAISLGTYAGGWRIMKTLGKRVIEMDPVRAVASQTVASSVLFWMAIGLKAPISTTHTITSAILGAGATRGRKWVRWRVVGNILTAWVITLPCAAAVGALSLVLLRAAGMP